MPRTNRGLIIASTLLLVAMLLSACEQPYSTPPAVTNTPIDPNSFFTTPIPNQPSNMQDVENITTQTAVAAVASPTPASSGAAPATGATLTATPSILLNPTATATQAIVVAPTSTSAPAGSKPSTYKLRSGEFPFCIARRFNVDPDALLSLSGLSDGVLYPPGTVLTIPQSGGFPGNRMLKNHPAPYTVVTSDETVYSIACLFGDVDPSAIASNNNISVDANLTAGQTLNIP